MSTSVPHRATLFLLAALLSPSLLRAAAPGQGELEAVVARMEEAEKKVQALSFDFTQTTTIRLTGEKQKIRGAALFRRPDKFRVEHKSPQAQTVVSDGKTLWFYNPSRGQVFVDSWENWSASAGFPKGLMSFQWEVSGLRKRYAIELERKASGEPPAAVLKLTPLEGGPWPYVFRLWVNTETGLPFRTELESQSVAAVTEIVKTRMNPALAGDAFTFTPPAGAEVFGSPFGEKEKR